eukprot:TRINITY_DN3432_c0_g1_i8.p1 TRINITY_DN3432_c0_g1~~TRINITY_DN3432_c0_g1_i8.p1  ORF type:complete len:167 (-),score=25.95 TRINITY_DN3432_c0_g1_i8:440-940(-)
MAVQDPLSSVPAMIGLMIGYLVTIGLGTTYMKGKKPFDVRIFLIPYNVIMCLYSGGLFIPLFTILNKNWAKTGYDLSIPFCDPEHGLMEGLHFWIYTFYLSKYVEYVDSFVLVLKGKKLLPPENSQFFLHVFHHAVTASIVWVSLYTPFSVSWIGPLTNSFVHFCV